jgi:hypothetical protein
MSLDVAIVVIERGLFARSDYFIKWMMREWAAMGLAVGVVDDPARLATPPVVFAHFDVTVVGGRLAGGLQRFPVVVNGTHADISKRRISANIVRPNDGYDGPVIVKTDLNFGGWPERDLRVRASPRARLFERFGRLLPWYLTGRVHPARYRIYPTVAAVPWPVWRNPRLVVERYRPERLDGLHALRHHYFLGDRQCGYVLFSRSPVVKTSNVVAHRIIETPPAELVALRHRLGLDYGRFDYVMDGDRVVLFDANRTPAYTLEGIGFPYEAVGRALAPGINAFLATALRPELASLR